MAYLALTYILAFYELPHFNDYTNPRLIIAYPYDAPVLIPIKQSATDDHNKKPTPKPTLNKSIKYFFIYFLKQSSFSQLIS